MNNWREWASAILVLAAFGLAGQMDYEDAEAEHAHCEAMVSAGLWPNEVCK